LCRSAWQASCAEAPGGRLMPKRLAGGGSVGESSSPVMSRPLADARPLERGSPETHPRSCGSQPAHERLVQPPSRHPPPARSFATRCRPPGHAGNPALLPRGLTANMRAARRRGSSANPTGRSRDRLATTAPARAPEGRFREAETTLTHRKDGRRRLPLSDDLPVSPARSTRQRYLQRCLQPKRPDLMQTHLCINAALQPSPCALPLWIFSMLSGTDREHSG